MIYLKLFYIFFKIGLFSFGGGLAMLPMVQAEVFKYGWLTQADFLDIISISQVTPGPIVVNTATFVGHKMGGILGAISATAGVTFPSLIIILMVVMIFDKMKDNPYKNAFFRGVKPVTLALILYAGIIVGKPTFINSMENLSINYIAIGIFLAFIYAANKFKVNPIFLLLGSGALGLILL
jgi:chromate transporter